MTTEKSVRHDHELPVTGRFQVRDSTEKYIGLH